LETSVFLALKTLEVKPSLSVVHSGIAYKRSKHKHVAGGGGGGGEEKTKKKKKER